MCITLILIIYLSVYQFVNLFIYIYITRLVRKFCLNHNSSKVKLCTKNFKNSLLKT